MSLGVDAWWKEIWSWSKVKDALRTLPGRLGFSPGNELYFFRLRLNLDNGEVYDEVINRFLTERERYGLYFILYKYAQASTEVNETGEYVTLNHVCPVIHCPMTRQNIRAFETIFGSNPELLYYAAKPFNYEHVDIGDAGVKIHVLPRVPIIVGIWAGEDDIPPSASILYDKVVTNYIDCEAASILAGVTLARLILSLIVNLNLSIGEVEFSYKYQCTE
ncbi:MAG: DUF3786 domain-containing protein [Nitrososphaerota archaeon]